MKPSALKIYLLILTTITSIGVNAQSFDSVLKKLDTRYPQEKLYLHFDRSVYNPGETIFFKAYLFSGNFPSLISKTLYTELTDAKGKVIQRVTAPILVSSAAASLDIPADVSGVVYVRAYTKWMLNFDSSYLFTKAISVIAPQKVVVKVPTSSTIKPNPVATISPLFFLQFFPEGGDLVQDVESRVAFKATDIRGMPIRITGDILDSKGKKITSFVSIHDGMGTFTLQPAIGEQYKAVWKDEQRQTHEAVLPIAKQNGLVLEINNFSSAVEFKIKRQASTSYPFVYIVAQMNQQLLYRAKVNITKTALASASIPLEHLPAGIMQITLFTPDEKPIAERIVFINRGTHNFITDLNTAVKDVGVRKKNIIQIDVPDTIACNLSVSVTDADVNSPEENDNIFSQLLLASDIKGYVHHPAYYFSNDEDSLDDHLDLVMMTNGWRRFKWKDVLAAHFPLLHYLPENYLSIEGQVHGLNRNMLAGKEINGIIELKNMNKQFINIPVQPDGSFIYPGMIYYDTAKLFYQFNNDKNKTLTSRASFDINNNLLKDPLHLQPDNFSLLSVSKPDTVTILKNKEINRENLAELENLKIKTLKTVVVTSKKKSQQQLMDEEYTSGFFSGGNSRTILPENDPAFLSSQNVLQYLQSRVAGLQISLSGATDASITWRGSPTTLFVNEMQQMDASYMLTLPMSDIALVKIFSPPFFGASGGGAGGAIAVYLKKGASGNQMSKGLDYAILPGYTPVKEFYSPDYSLPDKSDVPDYRPTLYWDPFVITNKNNRRIFLSFYNNDVTKRFKIIIEGCNEEGKLTRVEKIFQ